MRNGLTNQFNQDRLEGSGSSETEAINSTLSRDNVYIPYIDIHFEGSKGISLSWEASEDRPDYFTSLSHTRVTSQGSTMSISITYCPKYGEDINRVEQGILDSGGVCIVH